MKTLTTIEQALKDTASQSMNYAAGCSNRLHSLNALAESLILPDDTFTRLIGQSPHTIGRDLEWAQHDFQKAKSHYESVCRILGVAAYATYNED
jgi:isopenicillin N synthase-like dioxygenase